MFTKTSEVMCQFQKLYIDDNGYVVRCQHCKYYQVGFATTILTITLSDFDAFKEILLQKLAQAEYCTDDNIKSIMLPTPYYGVSLFLSKKELQQFTYIIEEADNEEKAQSLLQLFAN